jgi:hypothetical protein
MVRGRRFYSSIICQLSKSALTEGAGRLGGGVAGLGAEPGDRFIDALLERDCRLAEQIVGFVHRRDVVGDHAAVAGGSDVEGLSGQGGGEDAREV